MPDLSKLQYYSNVNFLKRSNFFSNTTINTPAGSNFNTVTINHNLGYVPFYLYAVDFNNDNILWANEYVVSGDYSAGGPPIIRAFVDSSRLYIRSAQNSNLSASGSRPVYYGIYLDFNS